MRLWDMGHGSTKSGGSWLNHIDEESFGRSAILILNVHSGG
jgi:hypothetical protein